MRTIILFLAFGLSAFAAPWRAQGLTTLGPNQSLTLYIQQSGSGSLTINSVTGSCGTNSFTMAEYSGGTPAGSAVDSVIPATGVNGTFTNTAAAVTGTMVGSATTFTPPMGPSGVLGTLTIGTTLAGSSGSVLAFTVTNTGTSQCSASLSIYGQ